MLFIAYNRATYNAVFLTNQSYALLSLKNEKRQMIDCLEQWHEFLFFYASLPYLWIFARSLRENVFCNTVRISYFYNCNNEQHKIL